MATVHFASAQDRAPRADQADLRDEPRPGQRDERHIGFGAWLRRAREARGLSLEEIARHTKIAQRHLEAVEHGNLGMRPAFYQRAEVRAFAREVGVDEQVALALFQSITAPAEVPREPRREILREELAQARTNIYALLPLYTVIVTVALFAWVMSGSVASEGPAKTAGASQAARVPNDPVSATSATPSTAAAMATTPTAAVAELVVTTEPSGARVTVNGIGWGLSPVTIRHLPDGDKRIRVSKDGYAAAERVLAVDRGARRALDIRLAPH
jgi:transcriptional regulator with XRE-family HTH domain